MALPKSGIQLTARNADLFIRQLAAAESAVDRFRKSAARPSPFAGPDTRNAVEAFNSLVAKAQGAGQQAGGGLAMGFGSGLSPMQTIVQGALLKTGALLVDGAIAIGTSAASALGNAFNDALTFDAAIDSIAALADGGAAASDEIAATIGSIATSPTLIANTESATAAFAALEKQGVPTQASVDGLVESVIALQNASGQIPGNLTETADAAEAVGQGFALFGLNAENAGAYVDTLAAITTNSKFTLSDLNYTLANSAASIQSLGLSFEDVGAAAISTGSAFSSARTQATSLDAFLAGLSAPTDKMKTALAQLGVSAYDANGDFVGLISLQDQLQASFNSGTYTTQAFQQLLTEGFGSVGRDFAVAIAKGEDFNTTLETIRGTSAEAIAAIKTDNAITAFKNLGDVAADLGRRIFQPFTEALTPAIQSLSSLLSSLAGYFDMVGQRIAASLSPILTYVTGQINALSGAISALTGISVPTLGAGAAPAYGPQPAPSSTFASGSAGTDTRAQERIGVAQLDSAKAATGAAKSMSSALSQLDDILSSSVSALDVNLANEGLYEDKPDEKLRQLRAYVKNGSEQYAGVADDYRVALERIGVKPAEDAETFLMQVEELQASKAIFADPRNIELLIDEEAVKREVEMKELAQKGAQNIALAFGSYVAGLVEATSSGISGGAAAPAAVTPPAVEPVDPTAFYDPYELYVKPVQDAQVAQAKTAASNQEGLLGGLFSQFDVLGEKFGIVTGLFEGFNTILGGLTESVQGQDFQAAGLAVGGTLTTVLGALTQITELADIGTTTANLSSFTQTILDSAANFADGVDGEAVAESAGTLLTTIVGKLVEAVDSADLTGIATSFTGMLTNVGGLLVEAIHGFDFAGVGLSVGTLVSRVANQLIGALQDPTVATNLGDAAGNFATGAIGALKGAFETLGGALATADENTDAGEITKGISGLITTVVSRFTSAVAEVKLDDLGTEVTGMIGHITTLFLEAVQGVQFDAIGTAIGGMVGVIVNKFTELISDPQVGIDVGQAAGDFVSGIITAVQGAFSLLSGALTGADDTIDITALTGAIDGVVRGFVQGFIESITRNFTNPDTGAVEIALPTVNVLPLETIDLSTLVSYINEPAKEEIDRAGLVSYINELPAEFQVEKDKLVSYINELPASEEIDKAKLVSYINELPGATEVDKAKLVGYINELPEPTEVDQSKLVQVTGALPETIELDLSSLVTFTGADSEGADVQSGFAPLTEAINLLAPALTGVSLAVGLADGGLRKLAEPGGGFDQLTGLVTGTVDTITGSIEGVDVGAIGGALNSAIGSITGLFVTLSEIPDLAPITASIGGFVTALLDLASGLVGNLDGEKAAGDLATTASNLVGRLAEGIAAVPLPEISMAAANLVKGISTTLRDALSSDKLGDVGESLAGLSTSILTQLTATLGDPDFGSTIGSALADLVEGLINGATSVFSGGAAGLGEIDATAVGESINTFLQSFVDELSSRLEGIDTEALGASIVSLLGTAVSKAAEAARQIDPRQATGKLADGLYTLIEGALVGSFEGSSFQPIIAGFVAERQAERDQLIEQAKADSDSIIAARKEAAATGKPVNEFELYNLQASTETDAALASAGDFFKGIFDPIAKGLSDGITTAFDASKVYTTDAADALTEAGEGLSSDIATYFAGDYIVPESISTGLEAAVSSVTGIFGSIVDAIYGFFDQLAGLYNSLAGLIGATPIAIPERDAEKAAAAEKTAVAEKAAAAEKAAPVAQQEPVGWGEWFQSFIQPATPEQAAPETTNTTTIVNNTTAGYNPLTSANAGNLPVAAPVEVKPVELSENAVTLLNNYSTAQAQANAQGQDTAALLPTAEQLLANMAPLPSFFYGGQVPENLSLAQNSLVSGTGTDAAAPGGEYGPPLIAALDANTAAQQQNAAAAGIINPIAGPLGDVEPLEYGADTVKLLEEQTEAIERNTTVQDAQSGSDPNAATNPKTAQEFKALEAAIPTAGQKFTVSLTGTATTSGITTEKIDKLGNSALEAVTPLDDMTTASDGVGGSLNILLGKSDATAKSIEAFNTAISDKGLTGGATNLAKVFEQAITDINAALKKLDGGSGTPTDPAKPPGQDSQVSGSGAFGGPASGKTLVGEQGQELIYNAAEGWSWLVGQQGAQFVDLPSGSYVYTNEETNAILRRSGKPTSDATIGSFAGGTGGAAINGLVGEPITSEFKYIPQGSSSDISMAGIQGLVGEPIAMRADGGATAGKALVGEEGPELAYDPVLQSAYLIGEHGPEIREFTPNTQIYTADETERILRRSGEPTNDSMMGSFAGGLLGNLASLLNQNAATPTASPTALPAPTPSPTPIPTFPGGPITIPQGDEGIQDDTEEATVTEQTSLLDNPFVRAVLGKQLGGQQQAGGGAFKSVASQFNSGDSFDVEKLVDAFNRPLFGRMSPASVTVNITVNNNSNVDNSVRTYTLGGITTQQRTESIVDSFRLLSSAFG